MTCCCATSKLMDGKMVCGLNFYAATPKQQTKHVMRMAEVSKTLRSTIHKYNNVVVHVPDSQYTVTSMEAITRGEYQWLVPRAEKCLGVCEPCTHVCVPL